MTHSIKITSLALKACKAYCTLQKFVVFEKMGTSLRPLYRFDALTTQAVDAFCKTI